MVFLEIAVLNGDLEFSKVIISADKIPNYKSGTLIHSKIGRLNFIVCNALTFTNQASAFVEYEISGFPPSSIGGVDSPLMCDGKNVGELWFPGGGILHVYSMANNRLYGCISYLSD